MLRDAHSSSALSRGHGEGYRSSHESTTGIVAQDYLGVSREYYRPVPRGFEVELASRLIEIRAQLRGQDQAEGKDAG
jgi:putative ATPase